MREMPALDRICGLIVLIRQKPRTVMEVVDLWRYDCCESTVKVHFNALHGAGLIYIKDAIRRPGSRGRLSPLYDWQPVPNTKVDLWPGSSLDASGRGSSRVASVFELAEAA